MRTGPQAKTYANAAVHLSEMPYGLAPAWAVGAFGRGT
jgi:hypothetical protein